MSEKKPIGGGSAGKSRVFLIVNQQGVALSPLFATKADMQTYLDMGLHNRELGGFAITRLRDPGNHVWYPPPKEDLEPSVTIQRDGGIEEKQLRALFKEQSLGNMVIVAYPDRLEAFDLGDEVTEYVPKRRRASNEP